MTLLQFTRRIRLSPRIDLEYIHDWRVHVLSVMLSVLAVLGSIVAVPSVMAALYYGLWSVAVVDVFAVAWLMILWRKRSLSFCARAWNCCAVFYLLGLAILVTRGAASGEVYLMAFPVLAALMLGFRPALFALALNAITLLGAGGLAYAGVHLPGLEVQPLVKLVVVATNFTFVSSVITISSIVLLDGLERTLERKRESEELYRTTFDRAPVGVSHLDLDGGWLRVNHKLCEITGYSVDEMLGLKDGDITHPEDTEPEVSGIQALLRGEIQSLDREKRYIRKDGRPIWVRLRTSLIRAGSGAPRLLVAVTTDVTQRRWTEDELRNLNDTLEKQVADRTRELEAFSYSIAHDLRAPLRAIDGYSSLVLRDNLGELGPESLGRLRRIREAVQRLERLIGDLLKLSRVSRTELRRQEMDMAGIARQISEELRETNPARDVHFTAPGELNERADPVLARIVLDNLLGNAWKYTGKVSPARIDFGKIEQGGETVYFVSDNGAGFDMEYAEKMFEPFQRMHDEEEFEGTGIGLSIVHRIVSRHGGKIWAESREGEGATFFFTLH